jgi:hypothetical protein
LKFNILLFNIWQFASVLEAEPKVERRFLWQTLGCAASRFQRSDHTGYLDATGNPALT